MANEFRRFSDRKKMEIAKHWARAVGIKEELDADGRRSKEHVEEMVKKWHQADKLAHNETGQGNEVLDDGTVVTIMDKVLEIYPYYKILVNVMASRHTSHPAFQIVDGALKLTANNLRADPASVICIEDDEESNEPEDKMTIKE